MHVPVTLEDWLDILFSLFLFYTLFTSGALPEPIAGNINHDHEVQSVGCWFVETRSNCPARTERYSKP